MTVLREWCRFRRDDQGRVTAFVVVLVTAILLFAGLVLDGGLALTAKVRALGEAQEAARAGAQQIDLATYRAQGTVRLLPHQAAAAAQDYVAATGDTGTVTVAGDTVSVSITITRPTQLLGLVGIRSLTVTGVGSAQPEHGITAPE